MKKLRYGAAICIAAMLWSSFQVAAETNDSAVIARSVVSVGNTARLCQAFAKARRGEPVTVAVIGGSVTQGARASKPENRYGNRVADWWRNTFPKSEVKLVNAGIGATGSDYGALRARRDLLSHHPDFVVVEFALNDLGAPSGGAESLEGLIRQILNEPGQPAVVLFLLMNQKGESTAGWHAKVGAHYGLPIVSFREALWPEVQAGRIQWQDIEVDDVHPNDRGHEYMALFVNHLLDSVLGQDQNSPSTIPPLPKPLLSDEFEHVTFFDGARLKPVNNSGWLYKTNNRAFVATEPGSVIEFEVEGQTVLTVIWREHQPFGRARMQVDDLPAVVKDAWFDQTWGGYRDTGILARKLKPGKHRLKIELLKDTNTNSTGHEFRLVAIGTAGAGFSQ